MRSKKILIIGRSDMIDLPQLGLLSIGAKVDTGAFTSSLHCTKIRFVEKEGIAAVSFQISGAIIGRKGVSNFETTSFTRRKIKSSTGHIENRVVIKTDLVVFGKKYKTEFSLTNRSGMKFPVLLGRKFLNKGFLVDVSKENLSHQQKLTAPGKR